MTTFRQFGDRRVSCLLRGVAVSCLLLLPSLASAQQIGGTVSDTTGGVLPGVTVEAESPTLIERVRSATTDGNGQYLIVALEPGVYTVRYSLPGFGTLVREGIELNTGFTATVDIELAVGDIAETVTVSGASPIVDIQNVEQRAVFDRDIIDSIPTGKSFQSYALLVPGMGAAGSSTYGTSLSQDSGGLTAQIWQRLAIHGGIAGDMQTEVNGLDVGDSGVQGANLGFWPDTNLEEIVVEYSANSAEIETGGVRINMIPKEGSNQFTGAVFTTFSFKDLHANNLDQELMDKGLQSGTLMDEVWTINPNIGGPLIEDKLWFFLAHTTQRANVQAAGTFHAMDPSAFVFEPDLSRPAIDDTLVKEQSLNLTYQATSKDKLKVLWSNSSTTRPHYIQGNTLLSVFLTPEAALKQAIRTNAYQATWVRPQTNRLLFEAGVSHQPVSFRMGYTENANPDIPGILNLPDLVGHRNGGGVFGWTHRHRFYAQNAVRASMSYVTGSHNLKFGFTSGHLHETVDNYSNTWTDYMTLNGNPLFASFRVPTNTNVSVSPNLGIYAQEQWTLDRLTVNAGVRLDYFKAGYNDQVRPVAVWNPVQFNVPGATAVSWKDLQPRLGVAYDLRGDGRTALKASFGRYGERTATDFAQELNPISNNIRQRRLWFDPNGDGIVQGDPFNFAPNGELANANTNLAWGQPIVTDFFDPNWAFGWGNRPGNWEMSASIQQELLPRLSVDFGYFRRAFYNHSVEDNRAVGPGDYDQFTVTIPTDPQLPGGGGGTLSGFDLNPGSIRLPDNVRTSVNNFGGQTQTWNGFDLTLDARLQDVLLQGGFSTGRTSANYCGLQGELPEATTVIGIRGGNLASLDYCNSTSNWVTDLKLLGAYTLPYDIQVAGTLQAQPGPERGAEVTYRNADVLASLGRPLTAGSVSINVVEPGSFYGKRMTQFDFRVTKILNLGGGSRLRAMLDIYNVFNGNSVVIEEYGFGANYLNPLVIIPGRLAKFAFQFDF